MSTLLAPQRVRTPFRVTLPEDGSVQYSRRLCGDVVRAVDAGERHVVVDCSSLERLELRVLSAIVRCARLCSNRGAEFELVNLADHQREILGELRLQDLLGLGA